MNIRPHLVLVALDLLVRVGDDGDEHLHEDEPHDADVRVEQDGRHDAVGFHHGLIVHVAQNQADQGTQRAAQGPPPEDLGSGTSRVLVFRRWSAVSLVSFKNFSS